jgi:hypothetical protein
MNSITKLTGVLINYSPGSLFILFLITGISFHSDSSPLVQASVAILNLIGGVFFLGWMFAIGSKAKEKLDAKGITPVLLKYYGFYFVGIIACAVLMLVGSSGSGSIASDSSGFNFQVTYTNPPMISLFFFVLLVVIGVSTAKALVSAEKGKDAEVEEYFTTILLFLFSFIGVWFIQPRAQKL